MPDQIKIRSATIILHQDPSIPHSVIVDHSTNFPITNIQSDLEAIGIHINIIQKSMCG